MDIAGDGDLNYRAFMQCENVDGWFPEMQAQIATWLREKGWDVTVGRDGEFERPRECLSIRHRESREGVCFRMTLEETTDIGTWTTELMAHDRWGPGDWLSVEVTNSKGHFVNVPRIAHYLLDCLDLYDGPVEFRGSAQLVSDQQYPSFRKVLVDSERHVPLIVVGMPQHQEVDLPGFRKDVDSWIAQTRGIAQAFVLSPSVNLRFNNESAEFSVPAGALRLLFPLSGDNAFQRHPDLSFEYLAKSDQYEIANILGTGVRRYAAQLPARREVERMRKTFARIDASPHREIHERTV